MFDFRSAENVENAMENLYNLLAFLLGQNMFNHKKKTHALKYDGKL